MAPWLKPRLELSKSDFTNSRVCLPSTQSTRHFATFRLFEMVPLCARALVLTVVVSALRHYEDDLAHEDVADVVGPKAITGLSNHEGLQKFWSQIAAIWFLSCSSHSRIVCEILPLKHRNVVFNMWNRCPDAHHCSQVEDQFAELSLNWTRPLTPRLHPEARAELQRKRGESMIQMEKGCKPSKFRAMGKKLGEGASKKLTCGRHIFFLLFFKCYVAIKDIKLTFCFSWICSPIFFRSICSRLQGGGEVSVLCHEGSTWRRCWGRRSCWAWDWGDVCSQGWNMPATLCVNSRNSFLTPFISFLQAIWCRLHAYMYVCGYRYIGVCFNTWLYVYIYIVYLSCVYVYWCVYPATVHAYTRVCICMYIY